MPSAKCIATLLALSALPAGAEGTSALKQAQLSARLFETGMAQGDPMLVATAARIRQQTHLRDDLPFSWLAMLDLAESLAKGDEEMEQVIEDIRADANRGVASGPIYHLAALAAGASETRPPAAYRGGEYAEAYVEAATGNDLNLTVLDARGNVICTDRHPSPIAYCGWTPATDGDFTLVIENAGSTPADYALMTN
ncbi:MAG: hypothetical protein R3D63_14720 [Paracoccaceae bacterium]